MQWSVPFNDDVPGRHSRHRDDRGTKTSQLVATYRQRLENSNTAPIARRARADQPALPHRALRKPFSAPFTSAACVQMIACGPSGMTATRTFGQQGGQAVPGGATRHHPVPLPQHDQDRDGDAIQVSAEVFVPRRRAAQRRGRRYADGGVEAVLPGLVADAAAAEQVDVVVPVQVGLDGRRTVGANWSRNSSSTVRSAPSGGSGTSNAAARTRRCPKRPR